MQPREPSSVTPLRLGSAESAPRIGWRSQTGVLHIDDKQKWRANEDLARFPRTENPNDRFGMAKSLY
jgi:hypothetical protein